MTCFAIVCVCAIFSLCVCAHVQVQRGIYLLDLQLLRGDPFTFMNLCARVIAELKVPAAATAAAAVAVTAAAGVRSGPGTPHLRPTTVTLPPSARLPPTASGDVSMGSLPPLPA